MLAAVFSMQSIGRVLAFATILGAVRDSNLQSVAADPIASKLVVDSAWRLTIGIGMIPAAIAIILRITIPETPRYYADIMKDLRMAVKKALKVYGRKKPNWTLTETNSVGSAPLRQNSDEEDDQWFRGAWNYLTGDDKAWRRLVGICLLWAILDAAFYGLSLDSPAALSTLVHNPATNSSSFNFKRAAGSTCLNSTWNTDFWEPNETIDQMLQEDSIRSILIVSIAGMVGSIASLFIINRFHRESILVATFSLLSILFAISGAILFVTDRTNKPHLGTTIIYAILQFVFNLGPNTLIFVIAAEIFPTVYRGTFYGVAAACGKVGAICIRAIIGATGNQGMSLGIRLLVFIPFMIVAAVISMFLPDVQYLPRPCSTDTESVAAGKPASETKNQPQTTEVLISEPPQQYPATGGDIQEDQTPEVLSLYDYPSRKPKRKPQTEVCFWHRLENMELEDITPNPVSSHPKKKVAEEKGKKKKGGNEGQPDVAQASGALPPTLLGNTRPRQVRD